MSAAPTTRNSRTPTPASVQRVTISRTALVAAWVLLVAGTPLALLQQPVIAGLAFLGALAASVASLDVCGRLRWATLSLSVIALVVLIVASLIGAVVP